MRHWHIWRLTSPTDAIREPEVYSYTATASRIIRREERFRKYGGFTRLCDDEECLEEANEVNFNRSKVC